jgi:hypothetical protein
MRTHREELDLGHNSFMQTISLFKENFLFSHTHALDFHASLILPAVLLSLLLAFYYKLNVRVLLQLLLLNIVCSLIYSFWYWEGLRGLKEAFPFFNEFNFGRFHLLRPFLWYVMFAIALMIIWKKVKFGTVVVSLLLLLQIGQLFIMTEEMKYNTVGTPTFAQFYDEALFQEIDDYIDRPKQDYRVASIALHPATLQYNGFYTLDTYNNVIPLAYKHAFREIIAPELAKSEQLTNYVDTWGSRLYVYSSEIGKKYIFKKDSKQTIEELALNIDAFKALGGEYILSGIPLENYEANGLIYENSFTHPDAYWKIYLYRVG